MPINAYRARRVPTVLRTQVRIVREAIAAGVLYNFIHIPGAINPADILSKHWGYTQVKTVLTALFFWEGDTLQHCGMMQGSWGVVNKKLACILS